MLQLQSLNWQCLLCPFNHEINPWFRHRAHLGRRADDSFSSTKSSALAVMEVLILLLFILFLWRSGDKWDVNLDDVDVIHTHHHKMSKKRSARRKSTLYRNESGANRLASGAELSSWNYLLGTSTKNLKSTIGRKVATLANYFL